MIELELKTGRGVESYIVGMKSTAHVAEALRRGMARISQEFIQFHQMKRLRGRPGLIMRSGSAGMLGSRQFKVDGSNLADLKADIFWSGLANRYVRIHEHGGTIVPVRAKWLRFQIAGRWIRTKKVTIPARLGWYDSWDEFEPNRQRILDRVLKESVEGFAK